MRDCICYGNHKSIIRRALSSQEKMATTLSRSELQALAKQHGVKANMKNAEIEAALTEKGVKLAKAVGLSVRDPNAQNSMPLNSKASGKSITSRPLEGDEENRASENLGPKAKATTRKTKLTATPIEVENKPVESVPPLPPLPVRNSTTQSIVDDGVMQENIVEPLRRRSSRLSKSSVSSDESTLASTDYPQEHKLIGTEKKVDRHSGASMPSLDQGDIRRASGRVIRYTSKRRSSERDEVLQLLERSELVQLKEDLKENEVGPATEVTLRPSEVIESNETSEAVLSSEPLTGGLNTEFRAEDATQIETLLVAEAQKDETPMIETLPCVEPAVHQEELCVNAIENNARAHTAETDTKIELVSFCTSSLILPPTPDKVREVVSASIKTHITSLDQLIAQYRNAHGALATLPALLEKQKELLEMLEQTRDENKRLKQTLLMQ